jgi:hypothetical protein
VLELSNIPEIPEPEQVPKPLRSILRWVARFFLAWLFFSVLVFLLLQVPPIQNWVADKLTAYLSKELQTKVSLDNIQIGFLDNVILRGFYVEDYQGDTLLYAGRLRINLNSGPWSWIQNRFALDEVELGQTRLFITTEEGELKNNLQILIEKLKKPSGSKSERPLSLDVRLVTLNDVQLLKQDFGTGSREKFYVSEGKIVVDEINLPRKHLALQSIEIYRPWVVIEKFPEGKLPPEELPAAEPDSMALADTTVFRATLKRLLLEKGQFEVHNYRLEPVKLTPDSIFNGRHITVHDIVMDHRNLLFTEGQLTTRLEQLSLESLSGFKVNTMTAGEFKLSKRGLAFNDMRLETPFSSVGDTFAMRYTDFPDFEEFEDKILMSAHFAGASIALRDIMHFATGLQQNEFFQKNKDEIVTIDGQASGKVNNLRGRDLKVKLATGAEFTGDFSSRNLSVKDEEYLNLRINRLRTTMGTIVELIPRLDPPENFRKLGNLDFSGSFDGFFQDFVANGELDSDLGRAAMDMRLNVKNGRERAEYSGRLSLLNFDLEGWTSDPNFGMVTLVSEVKDGRGLTGLTANAKLEAIIDSFFFKKYKYENIKINGQLNRSLFDGKLDIRDENIALDFAGEIDFRDSVPAFNFASKVEHLDLFKLNLAKQDYQLSGSFNLNLRDKTLSTMQGSVAVRDFKIVKNHSETFLADSIFAQSTTDERGEKKFTLASDLLDAEISGIFDIEQIPNAFLEYFVSGFPEFTARFGLKPPANPAKPARFNFEILVKDAKNFSHLASPKLDSLHDVSLRGYFNTIDTALKLDLEVPALRYDNWMFYELALQSKLDGNEGSLDAAVSRTVLNGKTEFSPLTLLGLIERDTYEFAVSSFTPILGTVDKLNLDGKFFLSSDLYEVQFLPSNLVIWEQQWEIPKDNFIRFGNKRIETQNFEFRNQDKKILLESLGDRGLSAELLNFDLSFIDEVWNYDKFNFGGLFRVNLVVLDIYQLEGISMQAVADSFFINRDNYGRLLADATLLNTRSPLHANINILRGEQRLMADGFYLLPEAAKAQNWGPKQDYPPNYFEINTLLDKFPLRMIEYLIGEGVRNTQGLVDAEFKIFGEPKKLNIEGNAMVQNAQTTINYLQTTYTLDQAFVNINNNLIDFTSAKIKDKYGNMAVIFGGIRHNHLKDWGLDTRILADRFLVLDTKKEDNPVYYGRGIGKGDIRFTGSFTQTNIFINAVTGPDTRIVLPLSSSRAASEVSFIRFREKNKITVEENQRSLPSELRGVNLLLQITATEDAEMLLVFDERAGDIIQGKGRGDVQLKITREGEFSMFGNYTISEGKYLFTLLNLVNKPFVVKPGGTISWYGDPYGAELNLVAEYKDLSTPPGNLVQEYQVLMSENARLEMTRPTPVELAMKLEGPLLRPFINFDISLPELTSDLKTYAESKLRIIKQDPNELNRQVFGLIVARQFLPSTYQFSGREVTINTLTEMLSSQLSMYLSGIAREAVTDLKFISGIDFDIAYRSYQSVDFLEDGLNPSGSELRLRQKTYLFDDRLSINFGGNLNLDNNSLLGSTVQAGSFTSGDIVVEYALTSDRRLKLRAYASQEVVIGGGFRRRVGAGLSYRTEFDTFQEFLAGFRKTVKKLEKQNGKKNQG